MPPERRQGSEGPLRQIVTACAERIVEPAGVTCCGFGGTFSVDEPEVSVAMGEDRVAQHEATGAEFIVGADPSCLMHMGGIIRHKCRPIRPLHIVEILTGRGGAA